MTFSGLKMIIFGHFLRFLASFKISFSSLHNPNHNMVCSDVGRIIAKRSHGLEHPGRSWLFSVIHVMIERMAKLGDDYLDQTQRLKEKEINDRHQKYQLIDAMLHRPYA